ncbi:MAG: TonB-dependent receptor, partial [Ignavibacteriae bacterium]|nr:TonB-dependent receptor [Ignavibacteriota bacterium]
TTKKIIDIPYSVERIDNTQYKFEKKVSVNDVLEGIPGLFLQNRYGNHDVRVSIRGFGSRSNSGIRGVRILLDGIPESEPDGQTRVEAIDFESVGSIEVVKGNSSSLYTNAPGGVINFINDIHFPRTFFNSFNNFGSFDFRSNGFKTGLKTDNYSLLTTYNYHTYQGYRPHSEDYWHILNSAVEIKPNDLSTFSVFSYFVDGLIRLPGSLTRQKFEQDPFQANKRDVDRDAKRITKKGRVALQFDTFFGEENQNELELTAYGTMKYFERTARTYRIMNRNGVGASARFVHHTKIANLPYEFSIGTDLFYQSGPIEEYTNINGKKGDALLALTDEVIANSGMYFQNTLGLIENELDLLVTGRFDNVMFDARNQLFEIQSDLRKFCAFTPKTALNYKLTPTVALYSSYGLSFDTPAGNELENYPTSTKPLSLFNPDVEPQKSKSFELGIKGNIVDFDAELFRTIYFDVTIFNTKIDDEIVPFEVFGDVFYRNAARTNRTGIEIGGSADIFRGLQAKTSYTFSDFSYDSFSARVIGTDSVGNMVINDLSYDGNSVPSVPKHNLSLTVSYDKKFYETLTGFGKASYTNVSGMYVDDGNSEMFDGYSLFNSNLGMEWIVDRFQFVVSCGVNNIFDKRYVAFVNINSAQKEFYEVGEPRNFFAGFNFGYTF